MVKSVKISGIKQEEKMNKTDGGKVPSRCKKKNGSTPSSWTDFV